MIPPNKRAIIPVATVVVLAFVALGIFLFASGGVAGFNFKGIMSKIPWYGWLIIGFVLIMILKGKGK